MIGNRIVFVVGEESVRDSIDAVRLQSKDDWEVFFGISSQTRAVACAESTEELLRHLDEAGVTVPPGTVFVPLSPGQGARICMEGALVSPEEAVAKYERCREKAERVSEKLCADLDHLDAMEEVQIMFAAERLCAEGIEPSRKEVAGRLRLVSKETHDWSESRRASQLATCLEGAASG